MTRGHPSFIKLALVLAAFLTLLTAHRPCHAQYGAWFWAETRVPLTNKKEMPATSLRLWTDVRFLQPNGLVQMFFRTGPVVRFNPFFSLATHGVVIAERRAGDVFATELRLELEPTYQGRIGDFTWSDWNRLEYRWWSFMTQGRYRNLFRVNYAPVGARWVPFVWNEIFIAPSAGGYNQNRATAGLGYVFDDDTKLDVGLMALSRKMDGIWSHDLVLVTYFYFGR